MEVSGSSLVGRDNGGNKIQRESFFCYFSLTAKEK
jgi:hypothetical protein